MTAASDTLPDKLALYPGLEFKVGDRICGTEYKALAPYSMTDGNEDFNVIPKQFRSPPHRLFWWINTFLSCDVTEAYTEWVEPEPKYSDHAAFRFRITWKPDQPLKIEAWSVGFTRFPETEVVRDDICSEDVYRSARRLLDIKLVVMPEEVSITVPLLTAVRLADELSHDSSEWEVV